MTATILDLSILILILISLIIGLIRGFVRELLSLTTWVAAVGFALLYVKPLSTQLPITMQSEVAQLGVSFAIIFFGVLIVGAIINYLLNSAVIAIGLGGLDHFLGGLFGALRGALIVSLLVILIGVTSIPANAWWVNSQIIPYFEEAAVRLKNFVPEDLSSYF